MILLSRKASTTKHAERFVGASKKNHGLRMFFSKIVTSPCVCRRNRAFRQSVKGTALVAGAKGVKNRNKSLLVNRIKSSQLGDRLSAERCSIAMMLTLGRSEAGVFSVGVHRERSKWILVVMRRELELS